MGVPPDGGGVIEERVHIAVGGRFVPHLFGCGR